MNGEDAIRRQLSEGRLVPSSVPREFTVAIGDEGRPPENGDLLYLAGSWYLVGAVSARGPIRTGSLHYLIEAVPTAE